HPARCARCPLPHSRRGAQSRASSVSWPRAEIVALADRDADMADEVVGGCRVELHLQHREMVEVVLRLQGLRLAANRHGDWRVVLAVDLVGLEALQEVDRLVEAGLDLGEAVVLSGGAR